LQDSLSRIQRSRRLILEHLENSIGAPSSESVEDDIQIYSASIDEFDKSPFISSYDTATIPTRETAIACFFHYSTAKSRQQDLQDWQTQTDMLSEWKRGLLNQYKDNWWLETTLQPDESNEGFCEMEAWYEKYHTGVVGNLRGSRLVRSFSI
jgi:hypothetical protein